MFVTSFRQGSYTPLRRLCVRGNKWFRHSQSKGGYSLAERLDVSKTFILEWLGMAPIYDSGSSLGYDKTIPLMKDRDEIVCKPFKRHHDEQLKLVSSFDWIDFAALADISEIITDMLSDERAADYMDAKRTSIICDLAEQRVQNLEKIAKSAVRHTITADDDVKENIAADYKAH